MIGCCSFYLLTITLYVQHRLKIAWKLVRISSLARYFWSIYPQLTSHVILFTSVFDREATALGLTDLPPLLAFVPPFEGMRHIQPSLMINRRQESSQVQPGFSP